MLPPSDPMVARRARLEAELARCVDVLRIGYNPERMILFGSLVMGKGHEGSDVSQLNNPAATEDAASSCMFLAVGC